MNRPLLLASLLSLCLTGCLFDGSAQEGTSSETQTSLQDFANRMVGVPSGAAKAGSARRLGSGLPDSLSSSDWAGFVESSVARVYLDANGAVDAMTDSTWNTPLDRWTYRSDRTLYGANSRCRFLLRRSSLIRACTASTCPSQTLPDHDVIRFRNGSLLESDTATGGWVLDGRWHLGPTTKGGTWDVLEEGVRIGKLVETTSLGGGAMSRLAGGDVFDLAGHRLEPHPLPDTLDFLPEALGIRMVSGTWDPFLSAVELRLSWNFDAQPDLVAALAPRLSVFLCEDSFSDLDCRNGIPVQVPSPVHGTVGSAELSVPVDTSAIRRPLGIEISAYSSIERDSGTMHRSKRMLNAAVISDLR